MIHILFHQTPHQTEDHPTGIPPVIYPDHRPGRDITEPHLLRGRTDHRDGPEYLRQRSFPASRSSAQTCPLSDPGYHGNVPRDPGSRQTSDDSGQVPGGPAQPQASRPSGSSDGEDCAGNGLGQPVCQGRCGPPSSVRSLISTPGRACECTRLPTLIDLSVCVDVKQH